MGNDKDRVGGDLALERARCHRRHEDQRAGHAQGQDQVSVRDTSAMRIKFGTLYFSIIAPPINPNMSNEYLDIWVKETS